MHNMTGYFKWDLQPGMIGIYLGGGGGLERADSIQEHSWVCFSHLLGYIFCAYNP